MKRYFTIYILLITSFVFSSCRKEEAPSPLDVALGTFNGLIKVYPKEGESKIYNNANIVITKVQEGKFKVRPINYTGASSVEFDVIIDDDFIVNAEKDADRTFSYNIESQGITVSLKKGTIENAFIFLGSKQK